MNAGGYGETVVRVNGAIAPNAHCIGAWGTSPQVMILQQSAFLPD
jgi:hypothetical protein